MGGGGGDNQGPEGQLGSSLWVERMKQFMGFFGIKTMMRVERIKGVALFRPGGREIIQPATLPPCAHNDPFWLAK